MYNLGHNYYYQENLINQTCMAVHLNEKSEDKSISDFAY